jgi:outer membrane protein OmpA-like peptidoglycan-associated protein
MSDQAYATVQAQQKTSIGSLPKSGLLQRTCACGQHTIAGGECEECRKKREGVLQRRAATSNEPTTAPPIVSEVLRSPGQPLDAGTRTFMEPRFGHDFSRVRVHTDAQAAESARAVNALAYTVGRDVVFNTGHYAPGTTAGRRLLAHELTHTIQQAQEPSVGAQLATNLQVSDPGNSYELEAEAQATRVVAGQAVAPALVQGRLGVARLQRQADMSQAPPGLPCILTTGPGHLPGTDLLFGISSSSLTAGQRSDIAAFVSAWVAGGSKDDVIVDGWASVDGPQPLNWRLSCERTEAVKTELVARGVPSAKITTLAHGESTEFSTTDLTRNRRAIITRLPAVGPSPTPPTPTPPTPTPPLPAPPTPTPTATITSETVATSPGARTRTTIGVGEEVNLTHSAGSATWATIGPLGRVRGLLSADTGSSVVLTAPDTKQLITVTAGTAMIVFTVIAPSGVLRDRFPATGIKHKQDRPDSGIQTQSFLLPDTVNFYNVQYHEVDVPAVANGVYVRFNGVGHDPHPATISVVNTVVPRKGTGPNGRDSAYSGDPGTPAPFAPGSITFSIPYEYKVGSGAFHRFATVNHVNTLAADASTLTTDKAGAHGDTTVASATSTF